MEIAGTDNHAIAVELRRHKQGIKVSVKVWPEVEEFFRHWGASGQERPQHGRVWLPTQPNQQLLLWHMGVPNLVPNATRPWSLLHTGLPLTLESNWINLSYLRLVGAGSPDGVEFVVESVLGRGELTALAQRISDAAHQFYSEYLLDITLRAYVGVQAA